MKQQKPLCKICGSLYHYQTFCPRKKNKPIKQSKLKQITIKKKPTKIKTTSERSLLIEEADRVFSIYIRRSYSVKGYTSCVTCGVIQPWKTIHNGHFLSRKHIKTRWSELNCHPQCWDCNVKLKGNLLAYETFLKRKYGPSIISELKSQASAKHKISKVDIKQIISLYTLKNKMLDT